tara:strand:+ start:12905 stop:13414 length:510 start_codon:yes stop_codon:yes gene_type:complete
LLATIQQCAEFSPKKVTVVVVLKLDSDLLQQLPRRLGHSEVIRHLVGWVRACRQNALVLGDGHQRFMSDCWGYVANINPVLRFLFGFMKARERAVFVTIGSPRHHLNSLAPLAGQLGAGVPCGNGSLHITLRDNPSTATIGKALNSPALSCELHRFGFTTTKRARFQFV